jgi:uncharacterized protein YoxC
MDANMTMADGFINGGILVALWIISYFLKQNVKKINEMHDFMITSKVSHSSVIRDIQRIDKDITKLEMQVNEKLSDLNDKVDTLLINAAKN